MGGGDGSIDVGTITVLVGIVALIFLIGVFGGLAAGWVMSHRFVTALMQAQQEAYDRAYSRRR